MGTLLVEKNAGEMDQAVFQGKKAAKIRSTAFTFQKENMKKGRAARPVNVGDVITISSNKVKSKQTKIPPLTNKQKKNVQF